MKKYILYPVITYILILISVKVYAQVPNLTYPSPNTYVVGATVTLIPTNSGNQATSISVTPALPAGLSIATDGTISGTPTTVSAATDYTVTATNGDGDGVSVVNLTINPQLPAITYNTPNIFTYGTTITALSPSSSGGAIDSYSISPSLPSGLIFDTNTGIISGKPTAATVAADYTVTASNVTGDGSFVINIVVNKATLTVTADDQSKVYGAANPSLTATYTGFVNGDTQASINTLATLGTTATTTSGVGTYTITASAASDNNYTFTYVAGTLTVTKATLTVTADDQSKVYGAANPSLTATYTGFVNGDTQASINTLATLGTTATTASGVGTYTITASAASDNNYTFTYVAGTLTVTKATLTVTADDQSKIYGAANPSLTATYTGFVNGDTQASINTLATLGTTATTASGVGSYTITASAASDNNYTFTYVAGTLTVTKATLTVTADDQSKIYGAANPSLTATYTGFVNGDTQASINTLATVGTTATTASGVGTYTITASAASDNNYTFTYVAGTLTVGQATLTITASNQTKTYGSTFTFAGTEFTAVGLKNSDAISSVTLASSGAASTASVAGSPYSITPSAANGTGLANYTIGYADGAMTVNAAVLNITANNQTKVYGSTFTFAGTEFTVTGLKNSDAVSSVTLTSLGAVPTASVAGSPYSIVPNAASGTGLANYAITYTNGSMAITQATLTITANNVSKTYGTALTGGAGSNAFTFVGLQNGETIGTVTIAYGTGSAANASVAGSPYNSQVTASAATGGTFNAGNYTLAYNKGNITITQATLTITANNISKTYGTALTGGTGSNAFTTVGLQNGETVGTVTIAYGTGSAANASVAGSPYNNQVTASAVTGGTFNAGNYSIGYNPGNITITQATLTITANNVSKAYGTALTGGAGSSAFTSVGLQNGETVGTVTIAYGTGSAANASVAGSPYNSQVTASLATGGTFNAGNYTLAYNKGNITITQATLTITANNVSKTYGTALTGGAGSNAFTFVGLQNGETIGT
ncbi:MAG: beta strand repeat-containing protein, partial [Mucilaginibacter sp.]